MITIRIDNILKAVSIERGDKQTIYVPRRASMRRLHRLLAGRAWVFVPGSHMPLISVWTGQVQL